MTSQLTPIENTAMSRQGDIPDNGMVGGGVYKPKSDMDQQNYTNPNLPPPASPPPAYTETAPGKAGQNGVAEGEGKGPRPGSSEEKDKKDGDKDEEKKEPMKMVGIGELFRYASRSDRFLMIFGTLMACIIGAAMPGMIVVFGNMTDLFIDDAILNGFIDQLLPNITAAFPAANYTRDYLRENTTALFAILDMLNMSDAKAVIQDSLGDSLFDEMRVYSMYYAIIGVGVLLVGYAQVACYQTASFNQGKRIRHALFHAILKQEIGWFDTHESGELNTRLSDDVDKIETGIGDKLSQFFQYLCGFLAGFVIGFVYGWKLTLVIISVSPLLAASGAVMGNLGAKLTSQELQAYAKAGAVAEEVIGSMRTVVAFGGQNKEIKRYTEHLVDARDFGIKKGLINGMAMGVVFLIMFCSYGLAFWYGSKLTRDEPDNYTPGKVMVVFFGVLIGAFSIGNAGPNIQDFANARGAAYAIWGIIDNVSTIDSSSKEGKKMKNVQGNVEFKDVIFKYPSRPDVPVLNGLNLTVNVGQTVALVGPSGCGKSTTVALLQRFYDVLEGQVLMDGVNIRELNVTWLRQQIGVVSQEPVLFATTIKENIRYGREDVTDEEIEKACVEANAHNFIQKLPLKYETMVGERGAQLSGGQKQRIAIARALVRDPKVLLLDEATSALDTESEATVQAALDQVSQSRTTIIIAHRLSTVRNADVIAGFSNGVIAEQGSHDELMKHQGIYYTLCTNQTQLGEEFTDVGLGGTGRKRQISESSVKMERMLSVKSKGGEPAKSQVSVKDEKEEEEDLPEPSIKRIMRMNSPEACYIAVGCIASVIMGGIQPAFAVVFSEILGSFQSLDAAERERQSNLYSGLFCVIGVAAAAAMFTMSFCFSKSGEHLTMRMRQMVFKAFLRQEIAFFDDSKNSTGALCARLAKDASAVQGATGARLATMFQSVSAISIALGIGFAFSWQLTLLILGFAPFILLSGFIQMKMFTGNKDRQSQEAAGKVAIEAIENIRTVAQLTKEEKFLNDYSEAMLGPYKTNKRKAHIQGIAFAMSQAVLFFAYAGCFTLGAFLVQEQGLAFQDMFKVFSAIVFSAMSIGQATSFAPDYGKAKLAASKVFQLLDKEPTIDSYSEEGEKMPSVEGSIQLKDVKFTYPTRPTVPVLKGVDIDVSPGQVVALVGSSGCGKSTIIQLMERFYDPAEGSVNLDGKRIDDLHIQWFRSHIGIVSQEPILFDCSIRDNIAYGDNSRDVGMDEVIKAAKNANIHNFIETLPLGYDTNVGDKGAQLSGGQKQRVAIARALVRDPKILLLDEATSALDTESEKVVQEALDKAQEGRTSIVIAHRLSTIQNADVIHVLQNGLVAETGTHSQLIEKRGIYYRLNMAQLKQV